MMKADAKSAPTMCLFFLMLGSHAFCSHGFFEVSPAAAFEFNMHASGGYDDNVTRTDDAEGSGFGLYRIGLARSIYKNDAGLISRLYIDGSYQDYFRFSDNYTIRAGGTTDWPLSDTLKTGLYYDAMFYRDREFSYDDENEFLLGVRLEWLAASAWTIEADQSLAFQDGEMEDSDLDTAPVGGVIMMRHGGRGMGGRPSAGGGQTGGGSTGGGTIAAGDGFLSRSAVGFTVHPAPTLDAGFRLMVNRRWASGRGDAYLEPGIAVFSFWQPDFMRFGGDLRLRPRCRMLIEYRKADYRDDGADRDRDDAIWFAAAGVVLPVAPFEFNAEARWVDVDSSTAAESYRKGVIQCGISFYF